MDDVTEILNLLHRYAERIDSGDFAGVGEMFAHAEVSGPGLDSVRGAEQVEALFTATTRRYDDGTPRTAHIVTNPIVAVDGDRAEVGSRFVVLQAVEAGQLEVIIVGRYRDRFERVDGSWRFSARYMEPTLLGDLSAHLLFDPSSLA